MMSAEKDTEYCEESPSSSSSSSSHSSPGILMKATIGSISLKFPTVQNLSTSNLACWLKNPTQRTVVLLDARPEEEYAVSHLEGAKRVNFEDENMEHILQQFEEELKDKPNPTVVCYCSLGYRSSVVARNLQDHYKNSGQIAVPEVYNLAGSLFQWANERRPMVDSAGHKTQFAHPYTKVWGKLLDSSLRKSTP